MRVLEGVKRHLLTVARAASSRCHGGRRRLSLGGGGCAQAERGTSGDVQTFALSAYDQLVVFCADQEHDEVFELFPVPGGGGRSTRLNGPLVAGGDVAGFRITANGKRVVFLADQDSDERVELYGMPAGADVRIRQQTA